MNKIYLDACIVIYFVEKHPLYSDRIEALFSRLGATDKLCISLLVRLGCMVMPLRTGDKKLQQLYQAFFAAQEILEMPVGVFDRAARLRADFSSLKTPDALHLATTLYHGCSEFWTNDNRLNTIAPLMVKNVLAK